MSYGIGFQPPKSKNTGVYRVFISNYNYAPMGATRLAIVKDIKSIFNIEIKEASNWVNDVPKIMIMDKDEIDVVEKLKPHFRCEMREIEDIDIIREHRLKKLGL